MAAKTHTDLIRELAADLSKLTERVDRIKQEQAIKDIAGEELGRLIHQLRERLAVAEDRVLTLKAAREESERRRWTLWLALAGCVLSLVANLLLLYFKHLLP